MDWGERGPKAGEQGHSFLCRLCDRTLKGPIHKGAIQPSDSLLSVGVVPQVKAPFPNLSTAAVLVSTAARWVQHSGGV